MDIATQTLGNYVRHRRV